MKMLKNNEIELTQIDEIFFQVRYSDVYQKQQLTRFLSVDVPNAKFSPKFKAKQWDGKVCFVDYYNNRMPIGLLNEFETFCEQNELKIIRSYRLERLSNVITDEQIVRFLNKIFKNCGITPRKDQQEAILRAVNNKRGVLELYTGFGKSLVFYSIIRFLMQETDGSVLFIVPSINLVTQMFSDMKDYGWRDVEKEVSLLFYDSDRYDPSKRILISTWQSLQKMPYDFFYPFESVLVDEVHGAKSKVVKEVITNCINSHYRLGMTGTMPYDKLDTFNIFAGLGHVLMRRKAHQGIEDGVLSDIEINNIIMRYNDDDIAHIKEIRDKYNEEYKDKDSAGKAGKIFKAESEFILLHPDRNSVFGLILNKVDKKENILILCERHNQIEAIKQYFADNFPERTVKEFHGKINAKEREVTRLSIEAGEGDIIISSYGTMAVGVNIPKIHHVIFASPYKKHIKILQSIGRGLRRHATKTKMVLWDLVDDLRRIKSTGSLDKNYFFLQFEIRLGYYKEQKFKFRNIQIKLKRIAIADINLIES